MCYFRSGWKTGEVDSLQNDIGLPPPPRHDSLLDRLNLFGKELFVCLDVGGLERAAKL